MKRIALIRNSYSFDVGGAEIFPINLAKILGANNYQPLILSANKKTLAMAKVAKLKTKQSPWWSFQNFSGLRILLLPIYLIWVLLVTGWYFIYFLKNHIEIVHPQSRDDFIEATLAAKCLHKKVFWSDHADLKYVFANHKVWYKNPIGKLVYLASKLADCVTIESNSEKQLIEESLGKKLPVNYTVIHLGVVDSYKPANKESNKIVFVSTSRLVKSKGIGELIEAFKIIDNKNAVLKLCGDGPDATHFKTMASGVKNIEFLGHVKDVVEVLRNSDVLVHPTYHEGFGLSLVEAEMCNLPIIASNVGSIPEIVEDGVSGILVQPKSAKDLAKAMSLLIDKPELRTKMGQAGREIYLESFQFDKIVKESFYHYMKSKIKILFDAGPIVNGQKSGVGYYTAGLVSALAYAHPNNVELVGHYFDFLGRKRGLELPKAPNIRYRKTTLIPGKFFYVLRRFGVSIPFEFLTKERGDFQLFPGYLGWPSMFRTPSAPAIHDLSYLEYPQYVSERNQKDLERFVPATISRSSFLITISEVTKQKIVENYVVHPSKIIVGHIPPTTGAVLSTAKSKQTVRKLGVKKKYLLFVGTIEPRKNIVGLIKGYELLPENIRKNYTLVLAGGKGWNDNEILATLSEAKQKKLDVIQTGYVSDDERVALYQQASLYILPSHYEGFGMPVLEASAYGVPVAVSDIPVLHEVAGDSAIYFDQNDPADIAANIEKVLTDSELRAELIKKAKINLERFSWEKTAIVVYDAIEASLEL